MLVTENMAEIVLVAEVDPILRRDMTTTLSREGFCVLTTASSMSALESLRDFGAAIGYLVTDIDLLDGCSGLQVAHQFRFLNPHGPVFCLDDGRTSSKVFHRFPDMVVLEKPISVRGLADRLATLRLERAEQVYA